ncbi:GNAT family N-acetyltransferase [Kineococcus sp. NBC_00420]|uniref:GNAT family N-acetyltransferase n=1 Tax=Kineococcus sp. NBC_00420 TaxID=2903564 RepID=UPI002E232FE8
MTNLRLAPLAGTADDVRVVQHILNQAPDYALRVTGQAPGPDDAAEMFLALPPGVDRAAKYVYGLFVEDEPVGVLDVIRGWPDPATAHIGLLLLEEARTGQGLGRAAYQGVEDLVRQWNEVHCVRAAVVATNDVVLPFWRSVGLTPTGETKPYQRGSITSYAIILTKALYPVTP